MTIFFATLLLSVHLDFFYGYHVVRWTSAPVKLFGEVRSIKVFPYIRRCSIAMVSNDDSNDNAKDVESALHIQQESPVLKNTDVNLNFDRFLINGTLVEQTYYGKKRNVIWDDRTLSFIPAAKLELRHERIQALIKRIFINSFIPSGEISPHYYQFTFWRMMQRLVSATSSVFGTQALLLALGIKQKQIGLAATISWVLKDALGKFSRIFWASRNGSRFDSDAKKWRFRSSILFAIGNGLEILTYLIPSFFLVSLNIFISIVYN